MDEYETYGRPTPPNSPAGTPPKHVLLTLIGGGFVLAFGGCILFLTTIRFSLIPELFAAAFIVGMLMLMVGIVAAVIANIAELFK
jgi:hypothetical protein